MQAENRPEHMESSVAADLQLVRAAAQEAGKETTDVELLRAKYEADLSSIRTRLIHAEVRGNEASVTASKLAAQKAALEVRAAQAEAHMETLMDEASVTEGQLQATKVPLTYMPPSPCRRYTGGSFQGVGLCRVEMCVVLTGSMCVCECVWWGLQDKVMQLKGALSDAIAAAEELDELVAKKEQEISTLQERNRELEAEKEKHAKQEAELSSLYRNSSMEVEELQVKSQQLWSAHQFQTHQVVIFRCGRIHACHMKQSARLDTEGVGSTTQCWFWYIVVLL